jgi:hypothetical protein
MHGTIFDPSHYEYLFIVGAAALYGNWLLIIVSESKRNLQVSRAGKKKKWPRPNFRIITQKKCGWSSAIKARIKAHEEVESTTKMSKTFSQK